VLRARHRRRSHPDLDEVERLFAIGADKVLLNTPFFSDPELCEAVASRYGSQALVAGIDVSRESTPVGSSRQGTVVAPDRLGAAVDLAIGHGAGEVLVQSVDRDGTGQRTRSRSPRWTLGPIERPLIVMGGVGRADHLVDGLLHPSVDAVATANLFNFVGDALLVARERCVERGVPLATWRSQELETMRGALGGDTGDGSAGAMVGRTSP
jgi:imidazole glycerol-phosphate synthase subunit HisF